MAIVKTEALLLKTVPFSDSSLILHFFTKENGKVSVIAKGARRLKSNFRGYLEPLSHVEIVYHHKPTREIQLLTSIDQIKIFLHNSTSLTDTIYATALIESLDRFVRDHQQDEEIFQMAISSLNITNENPTRGNIVLLHFLLHLIRVLGYQLDFHSCSLCHSPMNECWFVQDRGAFICHQCNRTLTGEHLGPKRVEYLYELEQQPLSDAILTLKPVQPLINSIRMIIAYLSYHLDFPVRLKSLDLLDTMSD